ncbi:hypothetical protein ACEWY4_011310 [Coilia grayii]|uniref:C2 domain-containing protein n=1 Tax=Coilia grayii TaxID=363190 RepID=A0ABD1K4E0_9TELE
MEEIRSPSPLLKASSASRVIVIPSPRPTLTLCSPRHSLSARWQAQCWVPITGPFKNCRQPEREPGGARLWEVIAPDNEPLSAERPGDLFCSSVMNGVPHREALRGKQQEAERDNVDLGDLMFSLCYLPTAGRLTITMVKARNLKAMDITGASDPYVKVSLMCSGRRLKKRKTSTKRNTLNPVYNEAIVFDVPPENIDQISLLIAVMDYDRVGHNEVIGICKVGHEAESLGRDHWNEMLSYPRKPIAHWHSLLEWSGQGITVGSQGSCSSLKTPPSP